MKIIFHMTNGEKIETHQSRESYDGLKEMLDRYREAKWLTTTDTSNRETRIYIGNIAFMRKEE